VSVQSQMMGNQYVSDTMLRCKQGKTFRSTQLREKPRSLAGLLKVWVN